jgi:hypothetical protein
MLKNHSMLSTRAFLLDRFLQTAKMLTIVLSSDGRFPSSSFIMDNPLHIPPDAQHGRPELMSKLACLKRANNFWSVLGGLCSFGTSIELVKKVSKMFIFLNLTLQSFGPEYFVPLVQIRKFQKRLIEENESYKMLYYA